MKESAAHIFLSRVRVLTFLCVLAVLVIVARLYYLQILDGRAYTQRADAQFIEPQQPLADRGTIYFSDKNGTEITAATMKEGFSLAVNPSKVTDVGTLWNALQNIVPLSHDEFVARATKAGSQYEPLAQQLDSDVGAKLEAQALPGLVVEDDRWRFYPGGSLAAQTLGFVAYNGDTQEGRYGLEQYYNSLLTETDNNLYANFFVQLFGNMQSALAGDAQPHGDVVTTLEPTVQAQLERELVAYDAQWHPQIAGGIIMNPQDGSIYAMAVSPTFDLNDFGDQADPTVYANAMTQNVYEMGSIMKPLTMAAGIDSGAITKDETYDDTGCITVDTQQICNYDYMARGVIPMQQILSQSLNVGASFIATQMGSTTMRNYFLNHYEIGSTTGIDLPGEQAGLVNNLYAPQQVDYDTAAFGQGVAVTPVTMVRMLAILANGGYIVTPHVGKAIQYTTGVTQTLSWPKTGPVLKPQTTADVTQMLTTVVDTAFAQGMSFPHYSVAAKTGTAQVVDPSTGAYYPDTYLHSFFGYFPSYNPQFIIFLFANKPVGAPYSSETWGSYFHELVQFLINYYNVPPDR